MRSLPRSSWRVFLGRFALALVLVVTIAASGIGGAYWVVNQKVDSIKEARIRPHVLDESPGRPANFLIIGSDTRAFVEGRQQAEAFGDAQEISGQRSDTIMIAHVDPETETGLLVSFPRDLWVDVPGLGEAKINAAFNAGPERVIQTIQRNFDIPIHHYLEVNFAGFKSIVDAIGHVPIFFPTPARDKYTGLVAPWGGCVELDGANALAYVRSRYYEYWEDGVWKKDPTSDLGRIRRQQYFIRTLAKVAIDNSARNPLKASDVANKVVKELVRDPGLGLSDLLKLANTFRNVDPAIVEMATVPWEAGSREGQSVLLLKSDEAEPLFQRLRTFGPPPKPGRLPAGLKPAGVAVGVLNGSGVPGIARVTLDALKDAGFEAVEPPDDADRLDYSQTEVRYATGAQAKALLVTAYLGGVGKLVPQQGSGNGAEVVVVLGRDFEEVVVPTPGSSTSAPTTTSTLPPSPGRTPGLTVPNGPEAGRPPVGC